MAVQQTGRFARGFFARTNRGRQARRLLVLVFVAFIGVVVLGALLDAAPARSAYVPISDFSIGSSWSRQKRMLLASSSFAIGQLVGFVIVLLVILGIVRTFSRSDLTWKEKFVGRDKSGPPRR